jgi:Flp pilus assembly pilin Flp
MKAIPVRGGPIAMRNALDKLWHDDAGQDVVEYALLAALIGLGSYGGFVLIQNTIFTSYGNWDAGQQSLWQPLDPGAYGS